MTLECLFPPPMFRPLLNLFGIYVSVGILNTALHWAVFYLLFWGLGLAQAWANLAAFFLAVTFSFVMNARYTFRARASRGRYFCFVSFMAFVSFGVGRVADMLQMPSMLMLFAFSSISLVLGFLYSRFVVFRN